MLSYQDDIKTSLLPQFVIIENIFHDVKQWVCGLEHSLESWVLGVGGNEVIAKVNVGQEELEAF